MLDMESELMIASNMVILVALEYSSLLNWTLNMVPFYESWSWFDFDLCFVILVFLHMSMR